MEDYNEDVGVLAEERFHEEKCDKEEYRRIFKFMSVDELTYILNSLSKAKD
jgi:hypothetical protein